MMPSDSGNNNEWVNYNYPLIVLGLQADLIKRIERIKGY